MYKPLIQHSLSYKYLEIFAVIIAYWLVSILTVFVNKTLLSSAQVNLDAPLFVTWFQCIISTAICVVMNILSQIFPNQISFPKGNPMDAVVFKQVFPLAILFASMIATNNLCLKYVGVAFYYVGRSLTTVFNVILSFILLGQRTSFNCIVCCALIVFGFILGLDQESLTESFSWKGILFGILGSLSLSLYSIYTKKTLHYVNQEIWLLSYYNNFYSVILFPLLILINGEIPVILQYHKFFEMWFWFIMIIGGICGFLIGYVTVLQIQVTSPLTHNISGTAKACVQTILATQLYQDAKSFLWWSSNIIVLVGSGLYARVKQLEMEKNYKPGTAQKA